MNDKINSTINVLPPFKRFCMTIGELPASYLETMTYYEMLLWFTKYLGETVIPTINNNAEAVIELQELFTKLQDYVNTYFDNLDVQEEINNKLDEMVEDGTFERIVNQLFDNKLDYYEITNQTEDEIQELFNIERDKIISFKNNYTFTKIMRLNRNTKILLNNNTITFNVPTVAEDYILSHGFYNFKESDEFLSYNGNGNITIQDGTIIGGNCSFIHGYNITFKNLHFLNCKNNHILEMAGINGLLVDNCIFEGAYDSEQKELIQIDDCVYSNFPWFEENNPTYDSTPNRNWIIKNSEFKASQTYGYIFNKAIGSHNFTENVIHKNIEIINNKFDNCENTCLEFYNINNLKIENNNFIKDETVGTYQAHIRLRNIIENVDIKNNYFYGSFYAIETAYPRLLQNKNITIENNTFEHYPNISSITDNLIIGIITINNPVNLKIINNNFKDFERSCIRVVASEDNLDNSIYQAEIKRNNFLQTNRIVSSIIRYYLGTLYLTDNIFNTDNATNPDSIFLVVCTDTTNFTSLFSKNNIFSKNIIDGGRDIAVDSIKGVIRGFENVYDVIKQYEPDSEKTTLTNQDINYDIFEFNTIMLTMGRGNDTVVVKLKSFTPRNKIDPRTWLIPVVKYDNTLGYSSITVNQNGTINYDGTNGIPFRKISLINEY